MELDWTTLLLEVINFLLLLWLLKRFFYRPLLMALDQRREAVERHRKQAEALHAEASSLKGEYEQRLAVWEEELNGLRSELRLRIEQERSQLLEAAREAAAAESARVQVAGQRRLDEQARAQELQALELGARFAARLMGRLADPHLEQRLITLLLEELPALRDAALTGVEGAGPVEQVTVSSAFPLSEVNQRVLGKAFQGVTGGHPTLHFVVVPELLAGLRVALDGWVLHANVADELKLFAGVDNDPG